VSEPSSPCGDVQGDDQPINDLETDFGILVPHQALGTKRTGPAATEFKYMEGHLGRAWFIFNCRTFVLSVGDERDATHDDVGYADERQPGHAAASPALEATILAK